MAATPRAEEPDAEQVERLAAHCHDEQWSGWMEYLFSHCRYSHDDLGLPALVIPNWAVERWQWQVRTAYADLPEDTKESDREEARGILRVLRDQEEG